VLWLSQARCDELGSRLASAFAAHRPTFRSAWREVAAGSHAACLMRA